jgi:uncharacterized membrane protein
MNDAAASPGPLRATRALAVGAALALIALGLAWELKLAPTGSGTLAVKVVPLLLPLPGLLRMRLYTYRWTSLLVWLYVAEGAVRATSERAPGALLAGIEIALALVLFVACASHVRIRLRADAGNAPAAPAAP